MGNLRSEFGHARPSGYRVIRYVRDGRTNGRTKAMLNAPFITGGVIIINRRFSVSVCAGLCYSIESEVMLNERSLEFISYISIIFAPH